MIALNNVTTGDTYSETNTRRQPRTVRANVLVNNAAVFLQLSDDDQTGSNFDANDEEFLPPGSYSLNRLCGGARVRSGAAGVPAQVSFTLLTAADLP